MILDKDYASIHLNASSVNRYCLINFVNELFDDFPLKIPTHFIWKQKNK